MKSIYLSYFALTITVLFVSCGREKDSIDLDTYTVTIEGKEFTFKRQMLYLISALEIYRLHIGKYPSDGNNLDALYASPDILEGTGEWRGPYATHPNLFLDPWGRRFSYSLTVEGAFDLRSLGPDGIRSDDDLTAKELFPDWSREVEKLSKAGAIPIPISTRLGGSK